MIEKHYGKYIGGDSEELFSRLLGGKTETFTETQVGATGLTPTKYLKTMKKKLVGPPGLEPGTNRL
jgi:hypothetical protein